MTEEMATFEKMPQMMATLLRKVDELGERFEHLFRLAEPADDKQRFNVDELRDYLPSHPRKQTIYS